MVAESARLNKTEALDKTDKASLHWGSRAGPCDLISPWAVAPDTF